MSEAETHFPQAGLLGVDIAGFNMRDNAGMMGLRYRLFTALEARTEGRRLAFADAGDGGLVVMPTLDAQWAVNEAIPGIVHDANKGADDLMRLRFAVHIGAVTHDEYGWIGSGALLVYRTIAARALKRYHMHVAQTTAVVAVSSAVYRSLPPSDDWDALRLYRKETRRLMWVRGVELPLDS